MKLFVPQLLFRIPQLGIHPSGRNGHDQSLHGTDLFLADLLFPGNAEVVPHSGFATNRHRRSQSDQHPGLVIQNRIAHRVVKITKSLSMFRRQHMSSRQLRKR